MIINIFGSSGSGTTTLAKALTNKYHLHHIDVDDLMWEQSDPPFTVKRDMETIKYLFDQEIEKNTNIVISGALVNIYDSLKKDIDLFIYMNLDIETRIKRINQREFNRFGNRIKPGGDLYQKHQEFLQWVSDYENNPEYLRSRKQHLTWLEDVTAPVLVITEELSIEELVTLAQSYIRKLKID